MDKVREKLIDILEKSEDLKKLTLSEKIKDNLYFFNKYILGYDLMTEEAHKGLCLITQSLNTNQQKCVEELNKLPKFNYQNTRDSVIFKNEYTENDLKKNFRLILMPRGSFKSTCVTIGYTLWLLLHNSNLRILVDSETFDKSRAFISEAKAHMEENEKYREIYKIIYGVYPDSKKAKDKWTDTELNVGGRTRRLKEPTLSAAGIGVTKVGMHYDVIIADDLHSEKNITTKEQIDTVVTHYKLLLSLLEPNGKMIVIGTRWDYKDTYQYILDNEIKRFTVYARQAIFPDGSLFFPQRLTQDFLESQKLSQGSYLFSCQYLNQPVDDETATFKASQMRRINPSDLGDKPINWFLLIDPAISQEKTADYTAMVIAGYDFQRNIYVKHILRGRFTPSEIVDNIFRLYEQYQPKKIGIEVVSFQKTLQYAINDKMKERGWWLPVCEVKRKTTQSKEQRIKGLQPYYEYGHIFHLSDSPFVEDLEYELIHFPKGQNDDIIDALADILEIGFPPGKHQVNTAQRRIKRQGLLKFLKPRSKITGY